jgi:amino acid transporter
LRQVEFILSVIKITACLGFMLLGIIINCGGVPTDNRGYIGAKYWYAQTFEVAIDKANHAV